MFDHAIAEVSRLKSLEEKEKSEPISNQEKVRIILLWCGWWDLNPHALASTST